MSSATALVPRDDLAVTTTRRAVRWWPVGLFAVLAAAAVGHGLLAQVGVVERATIWAGSTSWKAWYFGTLDPAAGTAVGSPAAEWIPALVVRFVGVAWVGVPGIALGVTAVAVLGSTVRRLAGNGAGLIAAAALAVCLPFEARDTAPALAVVLAGWLLERRRPLLAGLALGGAVLAAGFAGLGAVVVFAALGGVVLRRAGRWVGVVVRVVLGAGVVVGAWAVVAWWWPGTHPASPWQGSAAGVVVPALVALGVLAGAEVWRTRRSGAVRAVLVVALMLGCGVSVPSAQTAPVPSVAGVSDVLEQAGTTWSAATVGAEGAATLELASGTSVLAVGTGQDLTLTGFQSYVATGRVRYFVDLGTGSSAIGSWAAENGSATQLEGIDEGITVYDLAG